MNHGFKLHPDGTLEITMPKGKKVSRVLVCEAGTQNGTLMYPDCDDCIKHGGNWECDHVNCHKGKNVSNDVISRKQAPEAIQDAHHHVEVMSMMDNGRLSGLGQASNIVRDLPSAEPKKGKWIYGEKSGQDGWYCSECGGFIPWDYEYYGLDNIDFIADFHTCPKCDRKMLKYTGMRGEQE